MTRTRQPTGQTIAALGVVFGDIGTSPLYAISLLFAHRHGPLSSDLVRGGISLVIWTLTVVVAVKYALLVLRADNDGEGGVFALYGLLDPYHRSGRTVLALALLLGAGLLFGDGIITPAISVLSAVEGLSAVTPSLSGAVIPVTLALLTALFWVQRRGSHAVGFVFGPVMLGWFATIAALGLGQVLRRPDILAALSPLPGLQMLLHGDLRANLLVLGAVILVVTGGEAMFADMGHFGAKPIRRAWFAVAYPALLLCYLGQGAFLLGAPGRADAGLLFHLVPGPLLIPFIILATLATVIASQALISATFSLVSQAIALGLFPRLTILHTHHHSFGEVYVPFINWLLYAGCATLVMTFGSSASLGSAYGLAVSGDMLTTSVAMVFVAHKLWRWTLLHALLVFAPLAFIDVSFLFANSLKIPEGGYVPISIGLTVFGTMLIWRWGRSKTLAAYLARRTMPMAELLDLHRNAERYIEQTAVLMIPAYNTARKTRRAPALMQLLWERNRALPRNMVCVQVVHSRVPYVHEARFETQVLAETPKGRVIQVEMRFGFMEEPDVEAGLERLASHARIALEADHRKWSVYVVHEHLVLAPGSGLLKSMRFRIFELFRLVSRPTYYHYGLGLDVPLSVMILPVRLA